MKSYSFLILFFNPYELIRLEVFFQLLFRFTSVNQQQIQNQAVALSQTKQKYKCKTGKNQEICKVHVLSWNVNNSCVTEATCICDKFGCCAGHFYATREEFQCCRFKTSVFVFCFQILVYFELVHYNEILDKIT